MPIRARPWLTMVLPCLFVAACSVPPPADLAVTPDAAPLDFPADRYLQASARGEAVYEIDVEDSLIRVYAYRAGALARMGHDHVIASRSVRGFALMTPDVNGSGATVQADLYLPLAAMAVDDDQWRAEAGFESQISQRAKAGTRSNMLASVGAAEYPYVILHIEAPIKNSQQGVGELPLRATLSLHGLSRTIDVLSTVSADSRKLQAEGRFSLQQTDYGIKPHSALGGALAVQDKLDIVFRISAIRLAASKKTL